METWRHGDRERETGRGRQGEGERQGREGVRSDTHTQTPPHKHTHARVHAWRDASLPFPRNVRTRRCPETMNAPPMRCDVVKVSIVECDLELDFAEPVGYVQPKALPKIGSTGNVSGFGTGGPSKIPLSNRSLSNQESARGH